jgi:predicted nucleotidyltransferase
MQKTQNLKSIITILRRYRELLEQDRFPVERVILYGSHARGLAKPESDIDVCIISPRFGKKRDEYETYLWKKVLQVDRRIEPVGYTTSDFRAEDPLAYQIMTSGVEI